MYIVPSPTGSSIVSNTTEKRKVLDAVCKAKSSSRIEQSRGRKAAKPHECGLMLQMPVGEGTTYLLLLLLLAAVGPTPRV